MRPLLFGALILTTATSALAQPDRLETGVLGPGDETLSSGEFVDTYTVEARAGQALVADLTADDFDTYLIVIAPSGEQTDNDDWEDSYSHSRVEIGDAEGGAWHVRVTSFEPGETGAYRLALSTGSAPAAQTVRGTISDSDPVIPLTAVGNPRHADRYEVRIEAGQAFEAELTSDDFDTYLRLELDGERVAFNDDAGSTTRSYVEHVAARSGTYTLYAGTFTEAGRGAYTLRHTAEGGDLADPTPTDPPAGNDAFAATLNRLVNAFPDFDDLVGELDLEAGHHRARVALADADASYFSCFLGSCSFIAPFGRFGTEAEAERAYRRLVDRVHAVRFEAGSFVLDEIIGEDTRTSYWLPFSDNPDDLVVEVEITHNPFAGAYDEPPYGVVLRVTSI